MPLIVTGSIGIDTVHTPTDSASKEWIGNAALHGQMATVFAQLEVEGQGHGVHALLVPIRDKDGALLPGDRIEDCGHKMGLNGVDNGRIWFDHLRVPRKNLLNRYGDVDDQGKYQSPIASPSRRFFTMLGALVAGRINVACAANSSARVGLTIAIRYAGRRRQFGPEGQSEIPILDYRTHQRRLFPLLAKTYALHFALDDLAQSYVQHDEEDTREIEARAAALKAYATWHTTETLQICRECCGGQGYASRNRLSLLKNDTDVFTTFEGDNTVLLQLVAKSLLTTYKKQFADDRFFGVLRYLARQASVAIEERNPITRRNTDETHLLDPSFHIAVLEAREQDLLASVARRLKGRIDAGQDAFEAFNECQDHLIALAISCAERAVVSSFASAVKRCNDPALKPVLEELYALHSLSVLEKNVGWFLENHYFEPNKARAIRKMVNALCGKLRPRAVALVDAFGIPDHFLDAPIAVKHH